MRSIEEINDQIQKEYEDIHQLYIQIDEHEQKIKLLKEERKAAKVSEENLFIDNWLKEHFGIANQKEAVQKSIFIVFDENANFVKTVTTGYNGEFCYVGPVKDDDTLEDWLRKNKLYAHRASSFCGRNRDWYYFSLKEQLGNLGWEFDKNGKLKKTQW